MTARARQTTAVIITFRKSDKNSLERRAAAYSSKKKRNTLYTEELKSDTQKKPILHALQRLLERWVYSPCPLHWQIFGSKN